MNFTTSHYCKKSRWLLTFIGLWPEQDSVDSIRWAYGILLFLTISTIPQIIYMKTKVTMFDEFTAVLSPFATTVLTFVKLCTFVIKKKELRDLHGQINENWRGLTVKEEIEIMERYVSDGKIYAAGYILYMFIGGLPFIVLTFEPVILDIIKPLNTSRPLETIYPADYYFLDLETHFYLITAHMAVCCGLVLTIVSGFDTMMIIYTQYACGMFAVTGYRLEYKLYEFDKKVASAGYQKEIYRRYISHCVQGHQESVKLVQNSIQHVLENPILALTSFSTSLMTEMCSELIESIFSISYLVQLTMSILSANVTLLQILILFGKLQMTKYVLFVIGYFLHTLCPSYQGQKLLNHSVDTSNKIYNGIWYAIPTENQKLLLFMLTTVTPCYLTAGKIFVFTMESFSALIQTCMSYFMMLASFR